MLRAPVNRSFGNHVEPAAVPRPNSLQTICWAIFGLMLIYCVVSAVRLSIADYISESAPEWSLAIDSGQFDARVAIARAQYLSDKSRAAPSRAAAIAALQRNPLMPAALTLLGRIAGDAQQNDRAGDLMEWAARLDQRSLEADLWLLQRDSVAGDYTAAMTRFDVLMRGQAPSVIDSVTRTYLPVLTVEGFRQGLVRRVRSKPKWRTDVLVAIARGSTDIPGIIALLRELQATPEGLNSTELSTFLNRLVSVNKFDEAYAAWQASLPAERRAESGGLYNGDFRYPIANVPFDWVLTPASQLLMRVAIEADLSVLDVDFFGGQVRFANVTHLMSLPPGAYRLVGQERSQNLQNERGLRWRIACASGEAADLGSTGLLVGDVAWRAFGVDFDVPPSGCKYQRLLLELPARTALEFEVIGGASYANLRIVRR